MVAIKYILDTKSKNVTNINIPSNSQSETPSEEEEGLSEEFKEAFETGRNHVWTTVQLSIFDMYRNMEILDYDAQLDELSKRMDLIVSDDSYREMVIEEFKAFMEERDDGSSNDY